MYRLPTDDDWEKEKPTIPLAMQKLFYQLQLSNKAVSTEELTKSFGWDRQDAFMQHDIQELNRVLCDNLEGKMKGTESEGTIEKLFQGTTENFIECLNIDFKSRREEKYYDVQLDVQNCKNVYESFDKYVEIESLDKDNQYFAEGHGLQDAHMGVRFKSFPPFLTLQLKRFQYDVQKDAMVKINDKFEFYDHLDLTKYLSEDAKVDKPPFYKLYA